MATYVIQSLYDKARTGVLGIWDRVRDRVWDRPVVKIDDQPRAQRFTTFVKIDDQPRAQRFTTFSADMLLNRCKETVQQLAQLLTTKTELGDLDDEYVMNMHQCELLLRKLSDALADIKQPTLGENAVPVLQELLQSLETITTLIKASCITTAQWPNAAFEQRDMRETFSLLLYDVQWETSLLRSISADTDAQESRIKFEPALLCDGQLSAEDESALLAALEKDERSLKHRLRLKPVKDPKAQGLAEELLKQMESSSVGLVFLNPADLVKGTYLKHGGFGAIVRTEFLGMECAMKVVPEYSGFGRELDAVKKLGRHPHVVRTYCHSRENAEFYLIMEKMHMDLSEYLSLLKRKNRSLSLIEAVTLMLQIGEGMNFIHNKANVAHRDLKPQNILVNLESSEDLSKICSVRIADFGSTKEADRTRSNQTVGTGTTDFMAPEVIKEKSDDPKQAKYNPLKADVYSFAIMCWVILTGEKPYKDAGIGPTLMKKQVIAGSLRPKLPTECPLRLATVITTCWAGDHHDRPLFPEICRELRCIKGHLLTGEFFLASGDASDEPLDNAVLTRLKNFSAANNLMKKLVLKVIAESLSEEEIVGLRELFKSFDNENSGTVTFEELKEGLIRQGSKLRESDIRKLMEAADVDGNGNIDFNEFISATNKTQKEVHLFAAFQHFDTDNSGFITIDELQEAMEKNGMNSLPGVQVHPQGNAMRSMRGQSNVASTSSSVRNQGMYSNRSSPLMIPRDLAGLKKQLVWLVNQNGGKMTLVKVPAEYNKQYGRPLYLAEYNVLRLVDLVQKMKDTIVLPADGTSRTLRTLHCWTPGNNKGGAVNNCLTAPPMALMLSAF